MISSLIQNTYRILTGVSLWFALAVTAHAQRPDCEWCPVLDTPKVLSWDIQIADSTEPGERIEITGRVLQADGKTPAAGVILYLYHTNNQGVYPHDDTVSRSSHAYWHGSLRGWLKTSEQGEYRIRTIKPAPYPNGGIPAHIHCVVKELSSDTGYYIDDFHFAGDPHLPKIAGRESKLPPHILTLTSTNHGVPRGRRDIVLND